MYIEINGSIASKLYVPERKTAPFAVSWKLSNEIQRFTLFYEYWSFYLTKRERVDKFSSPFLHFVYVVGLTTTKVRVIMC